MRAVLFAKATVTSIGGLRSSMPASQEPSGAGRSADAGRRAQRTTALAPMIKRRRRSRWPIFEVFPSRLAPPLDCCRGVKPIQAARSRPHLPDRART